MCMSIAEDMGMSEEAVFRAVTSAPALAMGRSWGRLTVGGVADITVLDREGEGYSLTDSDGNHIENKRGYRCLLTLSDGQIVYKN
jgi:predicted amidohydrolase